MTKTNFSTLLLCFFCSSILLGQNDFKTKSVVLFKSGNGFFQKEANLNLSNGSFKIKENYPESTFGTLWFSSPNDRLESVTYQPDTLYSEVDILNRAEQIKANIGKTVTLILQNDKSTTGTIEKVRDGYLELKTNSTWKLISMINIAEIHYGERPIGMKTSKKEVPAIELKFKGNSKNEAAEMMYLNNKIGWFPNYQLVLNSKKSATLKFQARMMNDAENIENADIHFVVGVPNFQSSHMPSIFTADVMLQNIMQFLGANQNKRFSVRNNFNSNAQVMTQSLSGYGNSSQTTPTSQASGQQEDLFYYSVKGKSLKKGGRAIFDIFEMDIPIEHRYTVDLPQFQQNHNYNRQIEQPKNNPVKHKICIENPSKTPFTTGTVLIMNKDGKLTQPLAQSLIHFTSAGGDSKTEITLATDIRVNESLKELERKENIRRWNDRSWDQIKLQGKVKVKNFKNEKVKMEINKLISGELIKSNVEWEVTNNHLSYWNNPNTINDLVWIFEIGAGEEKIIEYEFYVYHN